MMLFLIKAVDDCTLFSVFMFTLVALAHLISKQNFMVKGNEKSEMKNQFDDVTSPRYPIFLFYKFLYSIYNCELTVLMFCHQQPSVNYNLHFVKSAINETKLNKVNCKNILSYWSNECIMMKLLLTLTFSKWRACLKV